MSEVEIFTFPYGAFLKQRLEFVLLRDDDLQSKIMRIIEYRMIRIKETWLLQVAEAVEASQPEPPEPDYWITLSYAQIAVQLYMFNSSRPGYDKELAGGKRNAISRNTIGKAMKALIEDQYVLTRPNPNQDKQYDATQYQLNLPLIQQHLNQLPKDSKIPIIYLATNGYVDQKPCTKFVHPPCTKILHGDAQNLDMGCKKNVHGDVKNLCTLIDIVIESDKKENRREDTDSAHAIASPPPSTFSDEQLLEELRSRGLLPNIATPQLSTSSEQFSTTPVDNSTASVSGVSLPIPTEQPPLHPIQTTLPDVSGVEIDPKAVNVPTHANTPSESHPRATTSQPHDELTDIDTVQASNLRIALEDTGKPATPKSSKGRGKAEKSLDLSPVLPPAKPVAEHPFTVGKIIAWGDYARKFAFPLNNHPRSKSYKSREAAKCIAGMGVTENTFLAVFFNWMKGITLDLEPLAEDGLKSETWSDYSVDLWVFVEHFEDEYRKYRKAKAKSTQDAKSSQHEKIQAIPGYQRLETIDRRRKPMSMEEAAAELQRRMMEKEAI